MPFRNAKTLKIELNDYGDFLRRSRGCFEVRSKNGNVQSYPHYEKEVGECVLKAGSFVSVDSLVSLALWNIDTFVMNRYNRVIAILKNPEDDSHVKTRIAQYSALSNGKGIAIAKQILISKIKGQNQILKKYNFKPFKQEIENMKFESLESAKKKLMQIESHNAKVYFQQIFSLFPEKIRPEKRVGYHAYDGINNVFNFGYYILRCRIHKALLRARLEPFLGFLHSAQFGKPSLVCDFQELYRFLIDDFLIERCQKLHKKDFVLVYDFIDHFKGKKMHLCEYQTDSLAEDLNLFFQKHFVSIPRVKYGSKQTVDTLISEEAFLFAKFLRNEKPSWNPRIVNL